MGAIEQAIKDLTAENEQMRRENASLRQAVEAMRQDVADIREAFDHLPPPTSGTSKADIDRLTATLTSVIDTRMTQAEANLKARGSGGTSSSSSSPDDSTWKIAVAGCAAVLLLLFASPFIAVHTSGNIDKIADVETTTDKILWNQSYSGAMDENGKQELVTPFTSQNEFAKWWNNQKAYLDNLPKQ